MTHVSQPEAKSAAGQVWSRRARVVVSLLLVLHMAAVFAPPFAFETSPVRGMGSPVAESLVNLLRPYIDAAYLNHGYAFFAPDPGPSHLLRARLEFDDGRPAEEITLPDLKRHWPRLLYHRHFMLSEHFHASFVPSQPVPQIVSDPALMDSWREGLRLYEARKAALRRHLQLKYGAARVTLIRVEHRLLDPYEFRELGKGLDHADTYIELSETTLPEVLP